MFGEDGDDIVGDVDQLLDASGAVEKHFDESLSVTTKIQILQVQNSFVRMGHVKRQRRRTVDRTALLTMMEFNEFGDFVVKPFLRLVFHTVHRRKKKPDEDTERHT